MQILTAFALLIPAFSLLYTPQPLTLLFLRVYNAPLPNPLLDCLSFGVRFSPVKFSAQRRSTSELLRTLLMVAASKPTSWLFMKSYILFHLVQHWGP